MTLDFVTQTMLVLAITAVTDRLGADRLNSYLYSFREYMLGKFYKKINWLINGAMIGLIIGGLIQQSVYTLVVGAIVGVSIAVIIKVVVWVRARRSLY